MHAQMHFCCGQRSFLASSIFSNDISSAGDALDAKGALAAPMGDAPVDMELGPKKFPKDPDARPVMPQIKPQVITEPQQMEAKAEDADIFIG